MQKVIDIVPLARITLTSARLGHERCDPVGRDGICMKSYNYRIHQMSSDERRFYVELLATHAWQEVLPIPREFGELQLPPGQMENQYSSGIHRHQLPDPPGYQGGYDVVQPTWPTAQESMHRGQPDLATHQNEPSRPRRRGLASSDSPEMTQEERDRVGKNPPPEDRYKDLEIPGLPPLENQPCLACVR